jgi:glycerate kinase
MRILLAPDKFRGSLTATEVATALSRGQRKAAPAIETDCCPIADGGDRAEGVRAFLEKRAQVWRAR